MLAFLLYRVLCGLLSLLVRVGADDRDLEIAVLHHQLRILSRHGNRPRYRTADRALLAAASRFLPRERWSAFAVTPDTLTRWRWQLERRKASRRRRGPGRPRIDPAVRELILRMARENPRWGYLRIKGELLKLGISTSATTIANVLRRTGLGPAPRRMGPTWSQFLRAQALAILATGASGSGTEVDRGGDEHAPTLPARDGVTDPRSRNGPAPARLLPPAQFLIPSEVGAGPALRLHPPSPECRLRAYRLSEAVEKPSGCLKRRYMLRDGKTSPAASCECGRLRMVSATGSQRRESSRRTGRCSAPPCRLA